MSTELDMRLWWAGSSPMAQRFGEIVKAVSDYFPDIQWVGLNAKGMVYSKTKPLSSDKLSSAEVVSLSRNFEDPSFALSTYCSIPAWRFDGEKPVESNIVMGLEVWERGYAERLGRMHEIEGDGSIYFDPVDPFLFSDTQQNLTSRERDKYVELNIEKLLDFVAKLLNHVQLYKLLAYDDAGVFLPINAHLAIYSNESNVLDDLQLIRKAWVDGLQVYNIDPLKKSKSIGAAHELHPWRSEHQFRELWDDLSLALSTPPVLTSTNVKAVLESGRFDIMQFSEGFGVLNYPNFVNGFIDAFYTAVINEGNLEQNARL